MLATRQFVNLIGARGARHLTQSTKPPSSGPVSPPAPPKINENVPGLSSKCVLPRSQPLGPGASITGEYKVPEYYCYDKMSYAEAEIEMANFRCPQPTADRKA